MKRVLSLDETPSTLERSFKAESKLKSELPTNSQNTTLEMREFLEIDKALQSIQGELVNNTSKLTEIDKHMKKGTKKLEEQKMMLPILMNKGSCTETD